LNKGKNGIFEGKKVVLFYRYKNDLLSCYLFWCI